MSAPRRIIFTDRTGDTLSVTPRDLSEFGNPISDPIISITELPGSRAERSLSVVFTDDEARQIIRDLAASLLGEEWGPTGRPANLCRVCGVEGDNIDGPDGEFSFCWGCAPEATVEWNEAHMRGEDDHRHNPAPFCGKCGGSCEIPA